MADGNVEAWTLLSIALFTIIVRMSVRWKLVGPGNWQLDDYLMPLAGIFFTGETVAAYLVGAEYQGLTNSYMTPEQRAALDPGSEEWANRVAGSKIQIIGWTLYAAILWLVKFSLAVFYSRLTTGLQSLPTRVRLAYVILAVTYIATALNILLSCQPFEKYWQIYPDPGNICNPSNSRVWVLVTVILNILTDIYLLFIPLPLLWTVNIELKRKIPLMALFSGATFVMIAGIIRAVTIMNNRPDGASEGSKWACRETFVSIIVSNLPIIQPIIRKGCRKIGLSTLFSSSGKQSQSYPLSSRGLKTLTNRGERDTKKSKSNAAAPSHMQASAWGSDEHILPQNEPGQSKDIHVTSETVVQSEPWALEEGNSSGSGPSTSPPKEWMSPPGRR